MKKSNWKNHPGNRHGIPTWALKKIGKSAFTIYFPPKFFSGFGGKFIILVLTKKAKHKRIKKDYERDAIFEMNDKFH